MTADRPRIGPLHRFLQQDHRRLDALLATAIAGDEIARPAYEAFRAGLLRHIGMEEKILLPTARRLRGGEPLAVARQLRLDHAALAALLVPTPTREIVEQIRAILRAHNPLEEDPGGLYDVCEQLAAGEIDELLARLMNAPEVPLAPHYDGPRALDSIERLLAARTARG
jgi:hypothetical protein